MDTENGIRIGINEEKTCSHISMPVLILNLWMIGGEKASKLGVQ